MLTIKQIFSIIDLEIKDLLFKNDPIGLYEPINYILTLGGKRIRPVLSLIACNLYTDNVKKAISPALGLELFHNFTLLHDDLMDNASIRRNKQTVHEKWNSNTAILSGDAMLICAYRLITKTDSLYLNEILELFNQTALGICEGQQYDMEFEQRKFVTEEEYLEMIRLKTAILLACCLKVGAIIGGASSEDANLLYQYGINLGLAFQLQDDFLDVYGNIEKFGKKIGNDIVSNKKTFLLIQAMNDASKDQLSTLNKLQSNHSQVLPEDKISAIRKIYDELNIETKTKVKINYFFEIANSYLKKINVSDKRLSILYEVNDLLINRNI